MKRFICLLLLLTLITQSFNKLGLILAFKVNQDYITASFCENKDKPKMNCNGRCFLAKKIKQAEQNEEKHRVENLEKTNILFFCRMNKLEVNESVLENGHLTFNPFYLKFKPSLFANDIFKPPQKVSA